MVLELSIEIRHNRTNEMNLLGGIGVQTLHKMTASTAVRIRVGDIKVFGPGIAELLERIDRCESIRTAAMEMHIAYSKAWTMLRSCEEALGFPLIERKVGGSNGGGSSLTKEGRDLLQRYRQWETNCKEFARNNLAELFPGEAE